MLIESLIEGHALTDDRQEACDVCIIGSGCGGATVAVRLAEAGLSVVVLEQGGFYARERGELDQHEEHMLARLDGGRGMDVSDDGSINLSYGNTVGGASVHYWADSYRTPADRLELWAREYGVAEHALDQLEPHFARIEADHHVEPAGDHLLNPLNRRLESALEPLGWHGHRVPQARKGCVSSGHCMQGCSYDAKQSQLVTGIPRAAAAGARIYSDARALTFDRTDGRIEALDVAFLSRRTGRPTGRRMTVRAKRFVVAAGGYQTAPFLLRQGLDARLPALGARLYCNPCIMTHGVFDEPTIQWRNIPAAVGVDQFRLPTMDGDRYREGGFLLMPNQLHPMTMALVLSGVGEAHHRLMRKFPYLGGTIAWIDDKEPGSIAVDDQGNPRWQFTIGDRDRLKCRDAMRKGAQWLFAAGASEVHLGDWARTVLHGPDELAKVDRIGFRPGEVILAGPHPAGSAPMGRDPQTSVVDAGHKVWGTDNLYIADPSVFPTAVSVDPSVTIMAFSHRLADQLLA